MMGTMHTLRKYGCDTEDEVEANRADNVIKAVEN
jgi:hypothetical protein